MVIKPHFFAQAVLISFEKPCISTSYLQYTLFYTVLKLNFLLLIWTTEERLWAENQSIGYVL